MRFAPVDPLNLVGFRSLISSQVVPQAGVPFTSSIFSRRKTSEVFRKEAYCVFAQTGRLANSALNVVWRATIAQAVRASLLASAHATTFECRRVSIVRTHSAKRPVRFSIPFM